MTIAVGRPPARATAPGGSRGAKSRASQAGSGGSRLQVSAQAWAAVACLLESAPAVSIRAADPELEKLAVLPQALSLHALPPCTAHFTSCYRSAGAEAAMGTVQGVYLKYVAVSTASYGLLYYLAPEDPNAIEAEGAPPLWLLSSLAYVSVVNAVIAVLFRLEKGMCILGKDGTTGEVPAWSYLLFAGFHLPTWLYTRIRHLQDQLLGVASADEVAPGWWLGGRYGGELGKTWAGVLDLTCEFPEGCAMATPDAYLLVRCWDGVPPSPGQLEEAAAFAVRRRAEGDIMVHCAHGRGRSTTVMCACLVKAGLFKRWEDAFDAIKARRRVVKLNRRMRAVLEAWQDLKKG